MAKVEIEGVGVFEIKHNYLHRGTNPRLITDQKGKYETLQFNSYRTDILSNYFQMGYDGDLNKIWLRIL